VVRHPISVFFLYYLSMYAFFLTPLLGYAMSHMWLMDVINLGFLAGATLFWWPMVGADPIPGGRMHPGFKLINLLVGVPIESFLGVAILLKRTPVASIYTLASTHTGGAVLWVASEIATIGGLIPIFFEWARTDEAAGRRFDARIDAAPVPTPGAPVVVRSDGIEGHGIAATFRSLRRG
jgi:cytochrome c oxidase assembly factor CtaG